MYFVDRNKIEETLQYIERLLQHYPEALNAETGVQKLALERIAQGWVEATIDVGNQMIDGFIMRDPGSYEDIIDILEDEEVITKGESHELKQVIKLRKDLVQQYTAIDHTLFQNVLTENKDAIVSFPKRVRQYLEQELGPVSAFLPKDEQKED